METDIGYRVEFETGNQISFGEVDGTGSENLNLAALALDGATGDGRANNFDATGVDTAVILSGEGGNDTLTGGSAEDLIHGGVGADALFGGAGDDVLFIDHEDTIYNGGEGNDIAVVTTENAVSLNLAGSDLEVVFGNVGSDHLDATGLGTDITLHGGEGNDVLTGGNASDILSADEGDDTLYGNDGDDIIFGGAGNDMIEAGSGDDRVLGGTGNDTLYGGYGNDVYIYARGDGADTVIDDGNLPPELIATNLEIITPFSFGTNTIPVGTVNLSTAQMFSDPLGRGNTDVRAYIQPNSTIQYRLGDGTSHSVSASVFINSILGSRDTSNGDLELGVDGIYFDDGIDVGDLLFEEAGNDLLINIASETGEATSDSLTLQNWQDDVAGIEYLSFGDGNNLLIGHIDTVQNLSENSLVDATDDNGQLLFGSDLNLNITTGNGDDIIIGGYGDDTINGGEGNDTILGGNGADIIHGGDGDDTLSAGGNTGNTTEYLRGEAGDDVYIIDNNTSNLVVIDHLSEVAGGGTDTVRFANLRLSDLTIDSHNYGNAWGDTLRFHWDVSSQREAGSLIIANGGEHIERFEFADGTTLGKILLTEWTGWAHDAFDGTSGDDLIIGTSGKDVLRGWDGNDRLNAGVNTHGDQDVLEGKRGDDIYEYETVNGRVRIDHWAEASGGGGFDTVLFKDLTLADIELDLYSHSDPRNNDYLVFRWEKDGQSGDLSIANRAQDFERFEFADGTTLSSIEVDVASGGRDRFTGTSDNDIITGTAASDLINGGDGDDVLNAGGTDSGYWQHIDGGIGNDTYVFEAGQGTVMVWEHASGGELDTIRFADLSLTDLTIDTHVHNDDTRIELIAADGSRLIVNNEGAGIERFEFADGVSLSGLLINEFNQLELIGSSERNTINGSAGNDLLEGQGDTDSLFGGDGDDVIYVSGATTNHYGNDIAYGGNGDDQITGSNGGNTLYGGDGNDILHGGDDWVSSETDKLYGGDGDDILISGFVGDNRDINLNNGDELFGGAGNDTLTGGNAHDILKGGAGNDTLYGGLGSDIFNFDESSHHDVIFDFEDGEDKLSFTSSAHVNEFSDLFIEQSGNDTIINHGDNSITLADVDINQVDELDFLFV